MQYNVASLVWQKDDQGKPSTLVTLVTMAETCSDEVRDAQTAVVVTKLPADKLVEYVQQMVLRKIRAVTEELPAGPEAEGESFEERVRACGLASLENLRGLMAPLAGVELRDVQMAVLREGFASALKHAARYVLVPAPVMSPQVRVAVLVYRTRSFVAFLFCTRYWFCTFFQHCFLLLCVAGVDGLGGQRDGGSDNAEVAGKYCSFGHMIQRVVILV